ncbi:hypothetical protein CDAR_592481 [Caerostris darwini]|uniref:Uncharacterized protein n=1 Tax=Caerostris darwini TaxID=1538125 RepID=A0AAV4TZ89_9ARAC|nr:hypothetical protein CDAR_592481 [Caerostris darwini]
MIKDSSRFISQRNDLMEASDSRSGLLCCGVRLSVTIELNRADVKMIKDFRRSISQRNDLMGAFDCSGLLCCGVRLSMTIEVCL